MEKQSTDNQVNPAGNNFSNGVKWYFKTSILVIALLSIGPLALPLLWFNPRLRRLSKIVMTIVILILTYLLVISFQSAWNSIMKAGYGSLSF